MKETLDLKDLALQYKNFMDSCSSAYFTPSTILERWKETDLELLSETEPWSIKTGQSYACQRNGSSLVLFKVGTDYKQGSPLRIAAAHTDSPLLKIKKRSLSFTGGQYRVGVEFYGSPIKSSWLDRDLGITGRVILPASNLKELPEELQSQAWKLPFDESLYAVPIVSKKPVAVIPNLAIHLNKELAKGFDYNPQTQLQALLLEVPKDLPSESPHESTSIHPSLWQIIEQSCDVPSKAIIDADLYFFDQQDAQFYNQNDDVLISSGRIDNLSSCFLINEALFRANHDSGISMAVFYDNEEIGSKTSQGADSLWLSNIFQRILNSLGCNTDQIEQSRALSLQLSLDATHAYHPSYPEKQDSNYTPFLGKGPAVKQNASMSYSSESSSNGSLLRIAKEEGIPIQFFSNRSDMKSGSTIGPLASSLLAIASLDMGIPIYGMHSVREIASLKDLRYSIQLTRSFFETLK